MPTAPSSPRGIAIRIMIGITQLSYSAASTRNTKTSDSAKTPLANHCPALVMPYGMGTRICPGKALAELEIRVMLVNIFRAYDVSLVGDFKTEFNFLLGPAAGNVFSFTRRNV